MKKGNGYPVAGKGGKMNVIVTREAFLRDRAREHRAMMEEHEREGSPTNVFIMPLPKGDEIICDDCSDLIETDHVNLARGGTRAVCALCFRGYL
ncbi:MAG: hypothetical protein ACRD1R_18250 [Acidobacteriota bacterium]